MLLHNYPGGNTVRYFKSGFPRTVLLSRLDEITEAIGIQLSNNNTENIKIIPVINMANIDVLLTRKEA